jgi:hypothetical protein
MARRRISKIQSSVIVYEMKHIALLHIDFTYRLEDRK